MVKIASNTRNQDYILGNRLVAETIYPPTLPPSLSHLVIYTDRVVTFDGFTDVIHPARLDAGRPW